MQYALQVFEYEDRSQFRIIDVDGNPWFVLADVCKALDIKNPSDAASRLDSDEKMTLAVTEGHSGVRGGPRNQNIINESGLYSLILRSDKPEAKRFKKWITSEVLPSIRKTGRYGHLGGGTPRFIRRYNENWDRIDNGHFSVISELAIRVWGRFEQVGHIMADVSPDGTELRPDVSVGKLFSQWLKDNHPEVSDDYSYYLHKTSQGEFPARQYPMRMFPLYSEFIETVWLPKHSEGYFKSRDPAALPHLPKLLPALNKPRAGMIKTPTTKRIATKKRR